MESLVKSFLANVVALCLGRVGRLPRAVREKFEQWAQKLAEAFDSSRLATAIATALGSLRNSQSQLADVLEAELEAVVALQGHALEQQPDPGAIQVGGPLETPRSRSSTQNHSRALTASKSLLGSMREVLEDLPIWAKGLLKIGEELIEIFGPTR